MLSALSLNQNTEIPLLGEVLNAVMVSPLQYAVVPEIDNGLGCGVTVIDCVKTSAQVPEPNI